MTSGYRSRMDIVAQILEAANDGIGRTRTKIMYKAYVSYPQLNGYLEMLVKKGLLDYDKRTKLYKTTEKGNIFLNGYEKIGNYVIYRDETYHTVDDQLILEKKNGKK